MIERSPQAAVAEFRARSQNAITFVPGVPYIDGLPFQLIGWHVYALKLGHNLLVVTERDWQAFGQTEDWIDLLRIVPVRTVRRQEWRALWNGPIVVNLEMRPGGPGPGDPFGSDSPVPHVLDEDRELLLMRL